jgi:hypothetical protein
MSVIASAVKLDNDQKRKLIKEVLDSDIYLYGENFAILSDVIDYISYADSAMTAAELLPKFGAAISNTSFLSATASGLAITSIVLFPVGAMIGVINAMEAGYKMYGMRSAAYSATAWSFGDPLPVASPTILRNLRSGPVVARPNELPTYNKAWNKAQRTMVSSLNNIVAQSRQSKDILQILFKAIGDNDRKKLCLLLLKGFESRLTPIDQIVWKSNYKVLYPQ